MWEYRARIFHVRSTDIALMEVCSRSAEARLCCAIEMGFVVRIYHWTIWISETLDGCENVMIMANSFDITANKLLIMLMIHLEIAFMAYHINC